MRDISADISFLQKSIKKALVNRLRDVIQVKVKDVTEEEEKLTFWMMKTDVMGTVSACEGRKGF